MDKKTEHGQKRAAEGRPTGRAWNDAQQAGANEILLDTKSEYYIVLGSRGRVHVFKQEQVRLKLHTSFKNPRSNTLMRLRTNRWRTLDEAEMKGFRQLLRVTLYSS